MADRTATADDIFRGDLFCRLFPLCHGWDLELCHSSLDIPYFPLSTSVVSLDLHVAVQNNGV